MADVRAILCKTINLQLWIEEKSGMPPDNTVEVMRMEN